MSGMEAALASGLLKVSGDKIVSLIKSEFASITGVKKDLTDLQDIHGEITSWLSLVDHRPIETDPQFRWVIKLKDVSYDIDNLVHEVELEAEKHKIRRNDKNANVDCLCAKPKSLLFRRKVARKIKAIKVGYAAIVAQRRDANTVLHNLQMDQYVQGRSRATGEPTLLSDAEESKIPVRDQVKTEIVSKLVESNKVEDSQHILSIVGLGGSGKTTMAQLICHDDKIKENFKGAIYWVHVSSQEFCREKLTSKLFEAVTKEKSDPHTQQYVVDKISSELQGKKFLLVLDDAWHDKRQDWEQFMKLLNNGASRSMILLTTRDQNVAKAVKSKIIFNLANLTEAESWSFFLKSSGLVEEDLNYDFIEVGKDIVKKCGGVPLAIKTLGGVLHDKTGINTWKAITESNLWDEKDTEGRVFTSLKLSYIHMKDHLKQCFVFCSIFPKGYQIRKDYLIEQWTAHGFIKLMGGEHPDDIGSEYLDSLVKAGFFLIVDTPNHWYEKELMYKMHDLIHDLARYCLQNEVVTSPSKDVATGYKQKCRYLSLTSGAENVNRDLFDTVRALYVSDVKLSFDKPLRKRCHIRSVVVDQNNVTPFPSFVLKFQYLGYLEIHNVECKTIPEAISKCWNLQSLHFITCQSLVTLPESIGKLKKLRTLELTSAFDLESLPQSVGDCQDLQSLNMNWCGQVREIPSTIHKIRNLRALHISKFRFLKQFPSEFTGEFSNLHTINLACCRQFQDLPNTLSCPMLCTLDLSKTKVTFLPPWVTRTSTLKCINLENCNELVELPKDIGKLKNLAVLNMEGCNKLCCMPSGIGQLTRLTQLGLFVVGCSGDDGRISEIENLDMLCGDMEIRDLKYLKDPCDAMKAFLKRKNRVQKLVLNWSPSDDEEEMVLNMQQDLGVLNGLEPPPQIKHLEIYYYRGPDLPRWMMEQEDYSYCEGTTLKQTGLRPFLSLTEMTLSRLPNIKYMRGLREFPSLKSLNLSEMANLEELWTMTSGFEILEQVRAQYCFPVLSELSLRDCPKLSVVKPYFPPSLEKLFLVRNTLQLLSPGNFSNLLSPPAYESSLSSSLHSKTPCLRELWLEGTTGSSSGWEFLQHRTELEMLCIKDCNHLTQIPESIRSLTSLQQLRIDGTSYPWQSPDTVTLGALPEWLGELCSLQHLDVSSTPMIASLPQSIGHLTSLTKLEISCCDTLKLLPDSIEHLSSLESLELTYCNALAVLPECIGQLSALQRLRIQGCSALQYLPQSIQQLTALQSLVVFDNPALARRYKQGVGPDWHLVSRIPYVMISAAFFITLPDSFP